MSSKIFFAALVLALSACSKDREEADTDEAPVAVRTQVVPTPEPTTRTFPGSVMAVRSADVSFEVGGIVSEILADSGDRVKAGQALARLDDRVFKSRLSAARAEAEQARKDADRAQTLLAQNAIAPAQAEALLTRAQAAAAVAEQASKALEDAVINAPFAGVVAARFVDPSESVAAREPVFRLHDLSAFTISIDLPQSLVLATRQAENRNPEDLRFRARFQHDEADPEGYEVRMDSFSPEPDERTGTYEFKLRLPAPADLRVLPGMTCSVDIPFSARGENVVFVPPAAIAADENRNPIAWVLDESGRATPRPVSTGELTSNGLEILDGLRPGDVLITAGVDSLTEGRPVRPL